MHVMIVIKTIIVIITASVTSSVVDQSLVPPENPLIIDHDGGADDSMAIFMALLYEKHFDGPKVVAITTTHGNVNEDQAFENTQRFLDIANRRDVPIFRGSNLSLVETYPSDNYFGRDGIGDLDADDVYDPIPAEAEHAVIALIGLSKIYKGKLTLVTLGPLTNIALAIRLDPNFISRLKHLYIGAGHLSDAIYPEPEFNALVDVEAYYVVSENSVVDKVTAVPFSEIMEISDTQTNMSKDWRLNNLGQINTTIMKNQNRFERVSLSNSTHWVLLDPYVMAMVLNNSLIVQNATCSDNGIVLCGDKRGLNTNNMTDCTDETASVNMVLAFPIGEVEVLNFISEVFESELDQDITSKK